MSEINRKVENALSVIRSKTASCPRVGVVLVGGFDEFSSQLKNAVYVPYNEIPDFPLSLAEEKNASFVLGEFEGKSVVASHGKLQHSNDYSQEEVAVPICIMKKLGVETIVLTCLAESVNPDFLTQTTMLVSDHINFMGTSPLIGEKLDEFGPGFDNAENLYTKDLRIKLKESTLQEGIALNEGVLAMYADSDSINYKGMEKFKHMDKDEFFRMVEVSAVGKALVTEALISCRCGIKVIGLAFISGKVTEGVTFDPQKAIEVFETAKSDFIRLVFTAVKVSL